MSAVESAPTPAEITDAAERDWKAAKLTLREAHEAVLQAEAVLAQARATEYAAYGRLCALRRP